MLTNIRLEKDDFVLVVLRYTVDADISFTLLYEEGNSYFGVFCTEGIGLFLLLSRCCICLDRLHIGSVVSSSNLTEVSTTNLAYFVANLVTALVTRLIT